MQLGRKIIVILGVVVFAAGLWWAFHGFPGMKLRVQELEVVDSNGNVIVRMSADRELGNLRIFSASGNELFLVGESANPQGSGLVIVRNAAGEGVCSLRSQGDDGFGVVDVRDYKTNVHQKLEAK
jgi:hypothetical protein